MKKVISFFSWFLLVGFMLCKTSQAQAQDESWIISPVPTFELATPRLLQYNETDMPGARFFELRAGERAQVTGILLNPEANAWLIANYRFIQEYWITEMNRRLELMRSWGIAEVAGQRTRAETEINALNVRIEMLEEQNRMLTSTSERLLRQNRRQRILFRFLTSTSALAVIAGATTTIVLVAR